MWFWFIVLPIALAFGIGSVLGAPYLPILGKQSKQLLDLVDLKPGQTLIDLGAGDGRLLKDAARRGAYGIGYEINPFIYLISVINCWHYRKYIRLHLGNYWQVKLPQADVIYVFLIDHFTDKLVAKLIKEITRPTLIVSYVFDLPGLEVVRRNHNAQVYRLPASAKGLPDAQKLR